MDRATCDFVMVQDYFMSETARLADLVMPASMPFESGGSYTNTQKFIQQFGLNHNGNLEHNGFQQLIELHKSLKLDTHYENPADVMLEAASILQNISPENHERKLVFTKTDNKNMMFMSGCDFLQHNFESINQIE